MLQSTQVVWCGDVLWKTLRLNRLASSLVQPQSKQNVATLLKMEVAFPFFPSRGEAQQQEGLAQVPTPLSGIKKTMPTVFDYRYEKSSCLTRGTKE